MSTLKLSCTLMFLFVFVAYALVSEAFAVDRESAASALMRAETETVSAFQVVLEAEQAGANVSGLLVQLNDAGENLARAETAYRLGNFDSAINFAEQTSAISEVIIIEANESQLEAYGTRYMDVWLRIIVSILGVTIVGFGSFWAWRIFKSRYYRRVLEMKPEVVSDES